MIPLRKDLQHAGSQINLFVSNLPKRPYSTDSLDCGLRVRCIETAITRRYIQANNPNSKLWLMFDVDRATAPDELTEDRGLPPPNLFVQNPVNKHAHVLYSLDIPVHLNASSSPKPIRFAGAVDCALSLSMDADAGYSGLIVKNPVHEHWRTYSMAQMPYSLGELSDYVDLDVYQDKRKHLPAIGLGRNCTLFDKTRMWAYKAIRAYVGDFNAWHDHVVKRASLYNVDFDSPLPLSEVKALSKSIAKWTWKRFSPEQFALIQAARGRKSGESRRQQSLFRRTRAIQLLDDGQTYQQVADAFNVSRRQVIRWKQG